MTDKLEKEMEKIVRRLMIRGYEMGKKQKETPFKYTLDTDSGENEWEQLLSLCKKERVRFAKSVLPEEEKIELKDINTRHGRGQYGFNQCRKQTIKNIKGREG